MFSPSSIINGSLWKGYFVQKISQIFAIYVTNCIVVWKPYSDTVIIEKRCDYGGFVKISWICWAMLELYRCVILIWKSLPSFRYCIKLKIKCPKWKLKILASFNKETRWWSFGFGIKRYLKKHSACITFWNVCVMMIRQTAHCVVLPEIKLFKRF